MSLNFNLDLIMRTALAAIPKSCNQGIHEWVNDYETLWDTGGVTPGWSGLPTNKDSNYNKGSYIFKRTGPIRLMPFQVCRHCHKKDIEE